MMEPWICPRCGIVWAGWVSQCECKPLPVVTAPALPPHVRAQGCTCGQSTTVPCPVHLPMKIQVVC